MFDAAERTTAGQIVLYERATGKVHVRWSPDAREMLQAHGDVYTLNPADCAKPAEAKPVEEVPVQTKVPTQHPLGGALKVTKSGEAGASAPLAAAKRTTRSAKTK